MSEKKHHPCASQAKKSEQQYKLVIKTPPKQLKQQDSQCQCQEQKRQKEQPNSQSHHQHKQEQAQQAESMLYGDQAIAELEIEIWDNPHPDLDLLEKQSFPEFTCKCPRSGYPDFATVYIEMIPDRHVIEMKCLKLYLNSYRDQFISHEAVVGKVFKDITSWIQPRRLKVVFDFTPRGNLHTIIEVSSEINSNSL